MFAFGTKVVFEEDAKTTSSPTGALASPTVKGSGPVEVFLTIVMFGILEMVGGDGSVTAFAPSTSKIKSLKLLSEGKVLPAISARVRSSQAKRGVSLLESATPLKLINWSIPPGLAAASLNNG